MQIFDSRGQLKESVARFFRAKGSAPRLILEDVDADADERLWDWQASNGQLALRTRTDADESGASPIVISRQGTTVTAISLAAGALTFNGTPLVLQSRQIMAGTGLTGGGDLSADRTISLSASTISAVNLAMSAVQPGDLANVAFSGDYADLLNTPTIPPDLSALQFLTAADESTALPNARRLVAGSNITFDTSTSGQLTIHATGSGGGGAVNAVIGGTGISVDNTDPTEPVVSLSADSQAALALATTAVQPEDLALVAFSGEYSDLSGIPSTFAPSAHSHGDADITGLSWAKLSGVPVYATRWPSWDEVTGKPSSFTPSAHTHLWADITDKPAAFTPSAHTHSAADITSGTLSNSRLSGVLAHQENIGPGADLNTYTTTGIWHQDANAYAASGTNYPVPLAGMLRVYASSLMIYQEYFAYHSNATYIRKYYDGSWEPWHQVYDSGHKPSLGELGAAAVNHTHSAADITSGTLSKSLIRSVNVVDTRNVNDPVSNFASNVQFDFKNKTTVSLPSGGFHAVLMTVSPWPDDSGGPTHQLAFDGSGRLFHRTGTRAGGWNNWAQLLEGVLYSNAAELAIQDANAVNRVWLYGSNEGFGFLDGDGVWSIRFSSGHRILNNNGNFTYGTYQIFGAVNGYTGLILNDGAHYPTFMSDSSWIGVYCQFGGRAWLWADDGAGILLRGKVRQYGSGRAYLLSNYDSANVTISTSAPSGGTDGDIWLQVL